MLVSTNVTLAMPVFCVMWKSGTVPEEMQTGVVAPILKKGGARGCVLHRDITLLNLPGKGYSRILEGSLRLTVEHQIHEDLGSVLAMEQWTSNLPLQGCWVIMEFAHVFCGHGEGSQPCHPMSPMSGTAGLWGALYNQSQTRSQWVLDSASVASCHRFCS